MGAKACDGQNQERAYTAQNVYEAENGEIPQGAGKCETGGGFFYRAGSAIGSRASLWTKEKGEPARERGEV